MINLELIDINGVLYLVFITFIVFLVILPLAWLIIRVWLEKVIGPIFDWVFEKLNM